MFGIVRVLKQIEVEQKVSDEERSEEDYSIRGYPNHILRWSLMLLLVILHFVRIFYFVQGYFLLTFVFGLFVFERLHNHLYTTTPCVGSTSDWFYTSHYSSSGDLLWLEPRVCALFSHKLSPDDFTSFVNRILEFKFWYFTSRMVVLVFLLTWIPLLKCSFVGPNVLFLWIIPDALEYADSIKKKLLSYLDKDAPTLRVK